MDKFVGNFFLVFNEVISDTSYIYNIKLIKTEHACSIGMPNTTPAIQYRHNSCDIIPYLLTGENHLTNYTCLNTYI